MTYRSSVTGTTRYLIGNRHVTKGGTFALTVYVPSLSGLIQFKPAYRFDVKGD